VIGATRDDSRSADDDSRATARAAELVADFDRRGVSGSLGPFAQRRNCPVDDERVLKFGQVSEVGLALAKLGAERWRIGDEVVEFGIA